MTTKMIRLKDRVIKVELFEGECPRSTEGCPCYDSDYDVCTLTNARDFDHCPLEDFIEPANSSEISNSSAKPEPEPASGQESGKSVHKEEPELMICESAGNPNCGEYECPHKIPHEKKSWCKGECDYRGGIAGSRCIPYTPPAELASKEPKHLYWETASPRDFINVKVLDWIEGMGEILTPSEVTFIQNFGHALLRGWSPGDRLLKEPIDQHEQDITDLAGKYAALAERVKALEEKEDFLRGEVGALEACTYKGMSQDIGRLKTRMDLVEQKVNKE